MEYRPVQYEMTKIRSGLFAMELRDALEMSIERRRLVGSIDALHQTLTATKTRDDYYHRVTRHRSTINVQ